MKVEKPHRGYVACVVGCYCPRCRTGNLFKYPLTLKLNRIMKMNENCEACGQPTDIEVGFYYGTSYVSYVIALLLTGIGFFTMVVTHWVFI